MKRLLLCVGLAAGIGGFGCGDQVVGPETSEETSTEETATQLMTPTQDDNVWAGPSGNSPPSNQPGPNANCEVEVLLEQY